MALRERAAFWLLALIAIRWVAPSGPLYWDSFAYTAQAVTAQVGGLGLGRPLFILLSHALARCSFALGAPLESIEPILRAAWSMVSALSTPLAMLVAEALGFSRSAQRWTALGVALSPAMAHASGQVLTDGPAVSALLGSTWCALRANHDDGARGAVGWLAAGALLGAAVVLREPSIAHALVLFALISLAPKGRRTLSVLIATGAMMLVVGLSLVWAARQPGWAESVRAWAAAMRRERAEYPYSLRDFAMYLAWLLALGPVTFVAAIDGWVSMRAHLASHRRALLAVAGGSLAQLIALGAYQDIAFSPRYLLGAMPGAIALPAALSLARRASSTVRSALIVALMALIVLITGIALRERERPLRTAIDTVAERLRAERGERVIVTGQLCPAVQMEQRFEQVRAAHSHRTPVRIETVCPGWGWPANLQSVLDAHLEAGRVVIADLRESVWIGERQLRARTELEAWVRQRTDPRVRVWR